MTPAERITKLEARYDELESRFIEFRQESARDRDGIRLQLATIQTAIDRQRTFIGGVLFSISALWAVIVWAKEWFLVHFMK